MQASKFYVNKQHTFSWINYKSCCIEIIKFKTCFVAA